MRDPSDCHDCGAKPGDLHGLGCDTERCYACGGQMLGCLSSAPCPHCTEHHNYLNCCDEMLHEEERLPWTGIWPGVEECQEFGWYSYFVPYQGFTRCDRDFVIVTDDPSRKVSEDLNRLHDGEAQWDRGRGRYVLRPGSDGDAARKEAT